MRNLLCHIDNEWGMQVEMNGNGSTRFGGDNSNHSSSMITRLITVLLFLGLFFTVHLCMLPKFVKVISHIIFTIM